jgi:Flp pilus assembly pilin Flp
MPQGPSGPAPANHEQGAAAVEFALVLPAVLILLFGVFEFGRIVTWQATIRSASREAARYGSAVGLGAGGVPRFANCDGIRKAGKDVARMPLLADGDISVSYDLGPDTSTTLQCPTGQTVDPALIGGGSRVVVTVTKTFDAATPFVGPLMDGTELRSTTRRTVYP